MQKSGARFFLEICNHDDFTEIISILSEELLLRRDAGDIIPTGSRIADMKKPVHNLRKTGFPSSDSNMK
jgi:hypothetical protein